VRAKSKGETAYFERSRGRFVIPAHAPRGAFAVYDSEVERGQIVQPDGSSYRFSGRPPRSYAHARLEEPPKVANGAAEVLALESLAGVFGHRLHLSYSAVISNRITFGDAFNSPPVRSDSWSLTGWLTPESGAPFFPLGWSGRGDGLEWLNDGCADALRKFDEALRCVRPTEPGSGPAVLSPAAAAVLVHEVVGHTAEAPVGPAGYNPLGCRIASEILCFYDDPTAPSGPVNYEYDDDGIPSMGATAVVSEGVLVAQLHSLASAKQVGTLPTANGRAASAWDRPIPRVSNLVCRVGRASKDELIDSVGRGLYVHKLANGINDGASVRAQVTLAERIEHGRCTGRFLAGGSVEERIGNALLRVYGVGYDLSFHANSVCGRAGQMLFNVGTCVPSMSLSLLHIVS